MYCNSWIDFAIFVLNVLRAAQMPLSTKLLEPPSPPTQQYSCFRFFGLSCAYKYICLKTVFHRGQINKKKIKYNDGNIYDDTIPPAKCLLNSNHARHI